MRVERGQRYRATTDVAVTCLTSWGLPYTGGYERTLPAGETIVISHDPPPGATAVYADPVSYRRLHATMVPLSDRLRFWSYRGYYLCIRLAQLEGAFERVSDD